jgi:uncharacterized OsmC-like protein
MKQKIIDVVFEENMKINAEMDGLTIPTDQSIKEGGDGTAPSPFQLFLASLATCAGVFARRFCEARELSTHGLAIRLHCDFAEKGFRIDKITYELTFPEGSPEKYKSALIRSVDLCTVKKHIMDSPDFEIVTR